MTKSNQVFPVTLDTLHALGQAIGLALTAAAKHPPTDSHAAGFTAAELGKLYEQLMATPERGAMHLIRAAVINGVYAGINAPRLAELTDDASGKH